MFFRKNLMIEQPYLFNLQVIEIIRKLNFF